MKYRLSVVSQRAKHKGNHIYLLMKIEISKAEAVKLSKSRFETAIWRV